MRTWLARTVNGAVYWYRRWYYRPRPLARIDTDARPLWPAWIIRVGTAGWLGALLTVVGAHTGLALTVTVVGALIVATLQLVRPGHVPAIATLVLLGLLTLGLPGAPFTWWILPVAVAAYLGLRWSLVAALLPWRARVEPLVLIGRVDAVVVASLLAIGVIAGLAVGPGGPWLALAGFIGLTGVALIVRVRPGASRYHGGG